MLLETLKRLECSLHGDKRKDREWLEQVLHEEFREITRSGMLVDRAETIGTLASEVNVPTILSSDFQLIRIRDNFAILHYRTFNPDGSRASLRSSCWECSGNGQWKLVFHQGTPEAEGV
ncbi:nuclear transport factor 2 family protein [Kosakonia sp. ML.JS2a]|uniref:nuclear transport factor 2 family protein n=1 Tax=Kosakonia sp. ML.JS2a TaxID=2980557 RepID=UPI0021D8D4C4|nr:nuclear transport factor 2 family protein [Kosakonia sp. ML.JS2a]UXY12728.1 nuclear transport factor 2 family protein [Kosakonia sp. ML.JS2a]